MPVLLIGRKKQKNNNKLARKNASDLAINFINDGFTVIIDDVVRQK